MGADVPIQRKVAGLPLSDQLKSYLNFTDLDEVEDEFNVTFREPKSRPVGVRYSDVDDIFDYSYTEDIRRHTVSPTSYSSDTRSRSSRSSFRYSGEFKRDSSKRRSLPPGFYSSRPSSRATSASPVRATRSTQGPRQNKSTIECSRSRSVPAQSIFSSTSRRTTSQGT